MRRIDLFILTSLLVLLLAWRLPGLVDGIARNQAALRAVTGCGDHAAGNQQAWLKPATGGSVGHDAWLKLIQARCGGDEVAARAALKDALAVSDERLDVAHSMENDNVDLARFAADKYPNSAESHFWLGQALTKAGDKDGATRAYEQGLALQPDAEMWLQLGLLYQAKDQYNQAVTAYDQACVLKDIEANGCSNAGELYLKMGNYELAAQRFQTSINDISQTWLPSEKGLVTALMALGRTQEAVPHLRILAEHGSTEAQQTLLKLGQNGK